MLELATTVIPSITNTTVFVLVSRIAFFSRVELSFMTISVDLLMDKTPLTQPVGKVSSYFLEATSRPYRSFNTHYHPKIKRLFSTSKGL